MTETTVPVLKLCVSCRHMQRSEKHPDDLEFALCAHTACVMIDPMHYVDGSAAAKMPYCITMRQSDKCSAEGKLFEPKDLLP